MLILQKNLQIYFTFCTCYNNWSTQIDTAKTRNQSKYENFSYYHPEKNFNRKTENFKSKNRSYDEIIDNEKDF